MTTARLIIAMAVLLVAAYIVAMNWGCVIASRRNKKRGIDRHHSTVPLVSFILAALAYGMYPYHPKGWLAVVPLVDIGNWSLVWIPLVAFREARKRRNSRQDGAANGGQPLR